MFFFFKYFYTAKTELFINMSLFGILIKSSMRTTWRQNIGILPEPACIHNATAVGKYLVTPRVILLYYTRSNDVPRHHGITITDKLVKMFFDLTQDRNMYFAPETCI